MPQAQSSQHLTLQDNQMLQRQLMLKQLQELQRQQTYLSQQSGNYMHANTSFSQLGTSAAIQGFSNGIFSQHQVQDLFMSPPSEQLAESRSSTPLGRSNDHNHYSHIQGLSSDSAITTTSNYQAEKPMPQSLYGRPVFGNQMSSPDLQCKQFLSGKNLFGQELNSSQVQTGSYEQFHGNSTKIDLSQGSATLDPLEQKILFNMDGNNWNSFGSNTENYTNTSECSDYLSSFPSIQSGSMSALMQSAVAESSSENGAVQEDWNDLSFPKTDLSMDNQQNVLVNNDVPSSLNVKPHAPFGGTNLNPGFSEFQFPSKHRELTRSDSSHESVQQSPKVAQAPLGNGYPFQGFQFSDGNADQRSYLAKSHDQSLGQPSFGSSMPGNQNVTSAAGQVNMRNQQQQRPSDAAVETQSPQATSHNVANKLPPFDLFIPRGTAHSSISHDRAGQQFSILESVPVESSRKAPNLWPKASDSMNTNLQVPSRVAQNRHGQQNLEGTSSREAGAGLTNSQDLSDGKEDHDKISAQQRSFSGGVSETTTQTGLYHGLEPVAKHLPEESGVGSGTLMGRPNHMNFDNTHGGDQQVPSVSARDFEVFGRSLKPSNLHFNYSSSSEKTLELGPSTSQFVSPYAFGNANMQPIKASSLPALQTIAVQRGTQGPSSSSTDLNVGDVSFRRAGDAQMNNQMAPWFKQHGALSNGQMPSMYDNWTTKNNMQPSPLGKYSENLEMKTSMVPLDVIEDSQDAVKCSSPSTLPPDFGEADFSMTGSRKRKTATSNLLSWHTEVTESSKRLRSISMAEMEWAKAVNRIVEKADYEVKMNEDMPPLPRLKKRLVLTRQLMQLVFMPSPAAFLRAKADSNYDSVAYVNAKLALGDACNLKSWSRKSTGLLCTSDNMMTEESNPNDKTSEDRFPAIVENFTSRAEKLESNFQRLDKTASIADVIVEYKELEKFSIINRFAKYHVRGPPKAAEVSTSSDSNLNSPKPAPQRYVQAFRPRVLPEKAQCLSL